MIINNEDEGNKNFTDEMMKEEGRELLFEQIKQYYQLGWGQEGIKRSNLYKIS